MKTYKTDWLFILILIVTFSLGFMTGSIVKKVTIKKDTTPEWCGIGLCGKQIGFTSDGYVIWKK